MMDEITPKVSRKDLAMTLAAALLGWMFDGFEMGLFPLVGRPALRELMGPEGSAYIGTWFSIIMAGFLIGAACGGILFGWLGDRYGRVRAMVLSVATYSTFSFLCVFVTAPWQLFALRFMAALGMGGEWSLGVALVMETWSSEKRTLLAGLIGSAANVGFLLVALMGLALSKVINKLGAVIGVIMPRSWVDALLSNGGWRMMLLLGALPALVAFFIQIFVPESKKWEHAKATAPKNRIIDIFKGGLGKAAILGAIISSVALLGTWGSVQWIPSWADKLSNQLPQAKSWAQIWSAIGAIIGCIAGSYLAHWTSRRMGYFILCLMSLISCQYLFRVSMPFGGQYLLWVCLAGGLTASFFGWLPLYLPELFPTRIRATGQGFAFNFGRVIASAGTLWAGQLLNAFKEDYAKMCSIITLVYVIGIVVIWFCPETKGRPLPE